MKAIFDSIDTDGGGSISFEELAVGMAKYCHTNNSVGKVTD